MDWLLKQVDLQRNVLNSWATENGLKFRCKIQPCQWQLVFIFLSPHFGNITSLNNKIVKALQFEVELINLLLSVFVCFRSQTTGLVPTIDADADR